MKYSLNVGDRIPPFTLVDEEGNTVTDQDLLGSTVVLFFYPKDCTPGCTKQACDFRDRMAQFSSSDARVYGISPDTPESHQKFIAQFSLNFPLLSDEKHRVCELFGVWREKQFMGKSYMGVERTTFLIDPDGIIQWIERPVKVAGHGKRTWDALPHDF